MENDAGYWSKNKSLSSFRSEPDLFSEEFRELPWPEKVSASEVFCRERIADVSSIELTVSQSEPIQISNVIVDKERNVSIWKSNLELPCIVLDVASDDHFSVAPSG